MLKRDASRQRPALPLPSLRLKEQRSRQPLGKTDGRRLSADSVRASVPPHSTGGKIPFRSFLHSLHARRRAAGHLSYTAFPMRVPADTRPAAPSQRRRKRKEVRRFPRLRSYGIRFASIPVLLYAIHGLLVGKSIKFKLVNQPIPGKGAGLQIAFRLFSGLLVPIGSASKYLLAAFKALDCPVVSASPPPLCSPTTSLPQAAKQRSSASATITEPILFIPNTPFN